MVEEEAEEVSSAPIFLWNVQILYCKFAKRIFVTFAVGGGGEAAVAAVKEVEEEVEEAPPAVDMFGSGDAGGGGDY